MILYSSGDIAKRLPGVSSRQVLDLAEKGVINPVRETTGPGSPRLYDFENVFEICLCLALRGRLPSRGTTASTLVRFLEIVRDRYAAVQQGVIRPFEALYIVYYGADNIEVMAYPVLADSTVESEQREFQLPLWKLGTKTKPQDFCSYLLEVEALRKYLKAVF